MSTTNITALIALVRSPLIGGKIGVEKGVEVEKYEKSALGL